jgi:lipid A 3-O-deacylase
VRSKQALTTAAIAMLTASPAAAGEVFGGIFAHDVQSPITRSGQEGGADLHLGWRGGRIEALRAVGAPSPHAFVSVNSAGDTNFAGVGISWRIGGPVYLRPGIGVAIHDGPLGRGTPPDRIDFGSRIVFVPELAAGVQIDQRWSVEAAIVHYSHAQILSRHNPGSDNIGIRVNYRFR